MHTSCEVNESGRWVIYLSKRFEQLSNNFMLKWNMMFLLNVFPQ